MSADSLVSSAGAPPRILFWSELFWPHLGGVEVLGLELVCAMKKGGYDFAVVTSHGPVEAPDRGDSGFHIR